MKKNIFSAIFMALLVLVTTLNFTSCREQELDTNQFTGELKILSFGPSPVARGGKLHIVGPGMSAVKTVVFPTNVEVTEIEKVNDEEIVVIVPRAAQPGYITVKTANKEATSTTRISYTEPVGFAEEGAITPNPVKPGETLTIKGTYLNLVQLVIFEKGVEVEVPNADRTKELDEIKVVVPAEARTGRISLAFAATGDTLLNEIPSKEVVEVVLPSVPEIKELMDTKPGDQITLNGKDFDLVVALLGTREDTLSFTCNEDFTTLTFTIPADACNGIINVTTASGLKVPVATIGVALPKDLIATPASELRAGDIITIAGKNLELVTNVTFPGVADAVALESGRTATEVKVAMPAMAVSGKMLLNTAAGVSVEVEIATAKPEFSAFAEAAVATGNNVTILGAKLDLVAKVTYTGGRDGEIIGQSATELVVTMPSSGVETGKLTLTMANGETAETGELTINAPEFCYVIDPTVFLTSDEVELKAGAIVVAEVENMDRLEGVLVDGNPTQYIQNGKNLYVLVPETAGFNSIVTLNSGTYGTIDYALSVIPNTEQKRVVWTGMTELTWNDGGRVFIPATAFDGVPAGAELVLCYTQIDQKWGQAQFNDGWWGKMPNITNPDGTVITNDQGAIVPTDLYGWFEDGILNRETSIVLTPELLDHFLSHVGEDGSAIVIQGADLIFTQVYIRWTVSLETTIYTGPSDPLAWGCLKVIVDDGATCPGEVASLGIKVGTVIRAYVTAEAGAAGAIASCWWNKLSDGTGWDAEGVEVIKVDMEAGDHVLEYTMQTLDIINQQGLGIIGNGFVVNKVTIQ